MSEKLPVDVPLIVKPVEPWINECLNSLSQASVYYIEETENMGEGRAKGFLCGDNPYVAIVDPDDYIDQSVLQKCVHLMDENPNASMVSTNSIVIKENGDYSHTIKHRKGIRAHHLCLFRRSSVIPLMDKLPIYHSFADSALLLLLKGQFLHIDEVGYFWRKHLRNLSKRMSKPNKMQGRNEMESLWRKYNDIN